MGFWDYTTKKGTPVRAEALMRELLKLQSSGQEITDPDRLRLSAGEITEQYPEDSFPSHAAWLDWPWKLHRIENEAAVRHELYNLETDPMEKEDRFANEAKVANSMNAALNDWLVSVVRSTNGNDYAQP